MEARRTRNVDLPVHQFTLPGIDAHGGRLWADANEPRGAVFQPHPHAAGFRGVASFENAIDMLQIDARAGIADLDENPFP
jgi:hypothetical protein